VQGNRWSRLPGHERDLAPGDLADHDRVAGRAQRGLDNYLGRVIEERVDARSAADPDLGLAGHAGQATFEPELDADPDDVDDGEPFEDDEDEDPVSAFSAFLLSDDPESAEPLSFLVSEEEPDPFSADVLRTLPATTVLATMSLEPLNDAHRGEHLAQPAAARTADLQRLVGELLRRLTPLPALSAGILIGRHGPS
jgi:hypothetical protein